MSHILAYKEWQSPTGDWHCNDTTDLGGQAGLWWIPAHMFKQSASEYLQWLIDNYHPDKIYYNKNSNFLSYSWTKEHYSLCHKFVLYINNQAKKKQFFV